MSAYTEIALNWGPFLSGRAQKKTTKNREPRSRRKINEMKTTSDVDIQTYNIHKINMWNIRSVFLFFFLFFFFFQISETNLRTLVRAWHLDNLNNLIQLRNRIVNVICLIFRRIYLCAGPVLFYATLYSAVLVLQWNGLFAFDSVRFG